MSFLQIQIRLLPCTPKLPIYSRFQITHFPTFVKSVPKSYIVCCHVVTISVDAAMKEIMDGKCSAVIGRMQL